jgi:sugar O-acyltransferase (sialic acid O-acetyltransferase NeuD family)
MGRIIIVGAGDFARELDTWIKHDISFAGTDKTFFIDDDRNVFLKFPQFERRLLTTIEAFEPVQDDRLVLGLTNPTTKKIIVEQLKAKSFALTTFIHNSVITAGDARIGNGSVLCPGTIISVGAIIGSCVTVNVHSTIGHDAVVGSYSSLMSHVDVTGHAVLGDEVYLGSHASVLPRVVVENGATIGAGSVAIRRVPAGTTVFGVPARTIAKN